jgi:hypothetical protein
LSARQLLRASRSFFSEVVGVLCATAKLGRRERIPRNPFHSHDWAAFQWQIGFQPRPPFDNAFDREQEGYGSSVRRPVVDDSINGRNELTSEALWNFPASNRRMRTELIRSRTSESRTRAKARAVKFGNQRGTYRTPSARSIVRRATDAARTQIGRSRNANGSTIKKL